MLSRLPPTFTASSSGVPGDFWANLVCSRLFSVSFSLRTDFVNNYSCLRILTLSQPSAFLIPDDLSIHRIKAEKYKDFMTDMTSFVIPGLTAFCYGPTCGAKSIPICPSRSSPAYSSSETPSNSLYTYSLSSPSRQAYLRIRFGVLSCTHPIPG